MHFAKQMQMMLMLMCCFASFRMLMNNIGRVKYPQYEICRQTKIFSDRAALLRQAILSLSDVFC